MTTVLLSDKHTLEAGQVCGHCNQEAPSKPKCWYCDKPMLNWPSNESAFLTEHGWEFVPSYRADGTQDHSHGWWMEPIARASGPVTEEMVEDAQNRMKQADAWLNSKETARVRREGNEELVEQGEKGYRLAQERLHYLEQAFTTSQPILIRNREQHPQKEAIAIQLLDLNPIPARTATESPMFDERYISNYEQGILATRKYLSNDDKRVLREMKSRKCITHTEPCHICGSMGTSR